MQRKSLGSIPVRLAFRKWKKGCFNCQLWLEEKQFLRKLAQSIREGSVNTSIDNLIYIHFKTINQDCMHLQKTNWHAASPLYCHNFFCIFSESGTITSNGYSCSPKSFATKQQYRSDNMMKLY